MQVGDRGIQRRAGDAHGAASRLSRAGGRSCGDPLGGCSRSGSWLWFEPRQESAARSSRCRSGWSTRKGHSAVNIPANFEKWKAKGTMPLTRLAHSARRRRGAAGERKSAPQRARWWPTRTHWRRVRGWQLSGVIGLVGAHVGRRSQAVGVNQRGREMRRERIGSSGRTRTYNPSVNSRMLYH